MPITHRVSPASASPLGMPLAFAASRVVSHCVKNERPGAAGWIRTRCFSGFVMAELMI